MTEESGFYQYDGRKIYFVTWTGDNSHRVALICHGLLEHSGRYSEIAKLLTELGFRVYSYDHPGHGQSQGQKGHINSFNEYIYLFSSFLEYIRAKERMKVTVVSHSMGGLIVLHYLSLNETHQINVERFIFSAPAINLDIPALSFLSFFLHKIAKIFPEIRFSTGIKAEKLTRDPKEIKLRKSDPLIIKKATLSLLSELVRFMSMTPSLSVKTTCPTLALIAGSDHVVSKEHAIAFFERFPGKKTKIIIYRESFHELFHEINRKEILGDIRAWLTG